MAGEPRLGTSSSSYDKNTTGSGYHVFSIRPENASSSYLDTRQYITRKSHRKSRLGCMPCKRKRIKCDEQRPVCGRCKTTNSKCDYQPPTKVCEALRVPKNEPVDRGSSIDPRVRGLTILVPRSIEKSSQDLHLLKHYDTITGAERDTITCSDLLYSYLLHDILAVAALHLDHHQVQGYRLAKLSHLQVALTEFQNAINKPIVEKEADPILLTAMMINMQYFCYVDSTGPLDSWVFSGHPSRLDWLSVQTGLLPLVQSTSQWHRESLLAPVWTYAVYERDARQGLPEEMLRPCGVHERSKNLQKNPYYNALQCLAPLMLVERRTDNLIKYLSCLNSLDKRFCALIHRNEPRALLILAYWFGLMCSVDFWWCRRRVYRDTTALCMYLDNHGNGEIRALLDFPANACGYQLQHKIRDIPIEDDFDVAGCLAAPA